MADWTDPPWAQLVAGKAWTDEKAAAAFENPIAIAEGADGAPLIQPRALNTYLARILLPGGNTNPVAIVDLDPETIIAFTGGIEQNNSFGTALQISASSDNGLSWGAWSELTPSSAGSLFTVSAVLNLATGILDRSGNFPGGSAISLGVAVNAIRFRHSSVSGPGPVTDPGHLTVYAAGKAT